jgi:hypothetical protein
MTEGERDALEAELSAMSPAEISPALRDRIGGELARPAREAYRWWRPVVATVGATVGAAACVLLGAWLASDRRGDVGPPRVTIDPGTTRLVVAAAPIASLADYRRALAESPARLDALLDAEAARPLGSREPMPAREFAHADRDF